MSIFVGNNNSDEYIGMLYYASCDVLGISAISKESNDEYVIKAIEYAEKQKASICCMAFDTYMYSES